MKMNVGQMVRMGALSALAVLLVLVKFPIIPAAPYLEYEPGDVPILIGAFMYGPVAGIIMTFVVSLIQALTVSAQAGMVGFIMHFIATGTLVLVSASIYKRLHKFWGAIIALVAGALSMTIIMIPTNLIITVNFWGIPFEGVVDMLLPIFIPFNMIKAFSNSLLTLVLYKSLSRFIKESRGAALKST